MSFENSWQCYCTATDPITQCYACYICPWCKVNILSHVASHDCVPTEEQKVINDAKDILAQVLARIEKSTRQYGTNYVLANVMKETEEEMLDIIGWPLLEVIRMRQLYLNKLSQLDGKYLDKFLETQTFEYLTYLKEKIADELGKRSQ